MRYSINSKTYTEVDCFLNSIGEEYRNKIPKKLLQLFKEKRESDYEVEYNLKEPLHKQNISAQAISIIALLHLNYWCENQDEKNELLSVFNAITKEKEDKKKDMYSAENIFASKQKEEVHEAIENIKLQEEVQMIEYKDNFFKKIIKLLKKIFKNK